MVDIWSLDNVMDRLPPEVRIGLMQVSPTLRDRYLPRNPITDWNQFAFDMGRANNQVAINYLLGQTQGCESDILANLMLGAAVAGHWPIVDRILNRCEGRFGWNRDNSLRTTLMYIRNRSPDDFSNKDILTAGLQFVPFVRYWRSLHPNLTIDYQLQLWNLINNRNVEAARYLLQEGLAQIEPVIGRLRSVIREVEQEGNLKLAQELRSLNP